MYNVQGRWQEYHFLEMLEAFGTQPRYLGVELNFRERDSCIPS
jgi:hypothetical protein